MPDLHLGDRVEDAINWLLATFPWLFDAISSVTEAPVRWLTDVLTGAPPGVLVAVFAAPTLLRRRWPAAALTVAAFALIDSMKLWEQTMQTLAIVIVAATIAACAGVPLGIWAARHRAASAVLRPALDLMQTLPVFVYLIPAVFFFGVGVVPGVVATAIFAVPPAVRLTELGIRQVDAEIVEAAHAFGSTPRQILRQVELPLALPTIMAGLNQVIMLALSMVVVAGLAGGEGLGAIVVSAVSQLDVGAGFEGGLAVVLLAIYLDRLTGSVAAPRRRRAPRPDGSPAVRGRATEDNEAVPA
jgi:glycine betaine/proline transport system permease protein